LASNFFDSLFSLTRGLQILKGFSNIYRTYYKYALQAWYRDLIIIIIIIIITVLNTLGKVGGEGVIIICLNSNPMNRFL
jgi:hypothetical protein